MERSECKNKEKRKMTVYFDDRAYAQKEEEEAKQLAAKLEEEKNRQIAINAVANLTSAVVKPVILMLLWNWLMPSIFGLVTIGYFRAFGLYLISRIVFDKNE